MVKGVRSGVSFHEGHFKYRLTAVKAGDCACLFGASQWLCECRVHARTRSSAAPELLDPLLPHWPRVSTVMGQERVSWSGAARWSPEHQVEVVVKHREDRVKGEFAPIKPLWRGQAAFAALGLQRRLAAIFSKELAESATAWMEDRCGRSPSGTCLTRWRCPACPAQ